MPANTTSSASIFWVTPQSQLGGVLASSGAQHLVRMTSDAQSINALPTMPEAGILTLEFNDITEPRPGLISPEPSHIERLLAFHERQPEDACLVLSCYAGISRSTAAAFILACRARPETSERELAQRLRHGSPTATPNILMVSIADRLMVRHGRMVAAIEAIGRGEDAFEGAPFHLNMTDGSDKTFSTAHNQAATAGEILP